MAVGSDQQLQKVLKSFRCCALRDTESKTVLWHWEYLKDGRRYKPYHAAEKLAKTVQVLGDTAKPTEYQVKNENAFKQMFKALDVAELISVDGENVISFDLLRDGQSYHLPPKNRRGWHKPGCMNLAFVGRVAAIQVAQLQRHGRNEISAKEGAMGRQMMDDAQTMYPDAKIRAVDKLLLHNAAGETVVELDAAVIVHLPKGGNRLILGEHRSTLTTQNAKELPSKQLKIWKMLKEPKEKAPEVHDAFASLSQDEVLKATTVVAGDQIVPLEDETFASAKKELLRSYDVVLTYSGNIFEPIS